VNEPVIVILAAGQGTRMRSRTPKLLHTICGRTMIGWALAAARAAGAGRIVVVDAPGEPLRAQLDADVELVVQPLPDGTGGALRAAAGALGDAETVVVINGDVPLLGADTIEALAQAHARSGAAATIATSILDEPAGWGRIVRGADGGVERIVETRTPGDASSDELGIREVNTGIYGFSAEALGPALALLTSDNAQGEYYLTQLPAILRAAGHRVQAFPLSDAGEVFNVNDRVQLAQATAVAQRRIIERHMRAGVTIVSPETTVIDADVRLAPDVLIQPGSALHGATTVGEGAVIGPHSTLLDCSVDAGSQVLHSYVVGAVIGERVSVGPFAYLRPGTVLHAGAKAGSFVEIKNSEVGERSKVPHLSYIGDATIGAETNLGASTITANYDGIAKHRTVIGSRVRTGVDTTLVAPVVLADDAYTGAGSVITRDVPAGALAIARERQRNIENYAERVGEQPARHDSTQARTGHGGSSQRG
jgi:bifunctional UDP-N-acetylglucosamine pyrophosphorylase/glucosamine-1-phosphate N-acetyltransferase